MATTDVLVAGERYWEADRAFQNAQLADRDAKQRSLDAHARFEQARDDLTAAREELLRAALAAGAQRVVRIDVVFGPAEPIP